MRGCTLFYNLILTVSVLSSCQQSIKENKKPNVVIIFLDDAAYGNFKPSGQEGIETPEVQ